LRKCHNGTLTEFNQTSVNKHTVSEGTACPSYLNDPAYLRARHALGAQRRAKAITAKAIAWCKEQCGKEMPQISRRETGRMMMSRIMHRLSVTKEAVDAKQEPENKLSIPGKPSAEDFAYVLRLLRGAPARSL
jgi:hypothetical protein